MSTSLVDLLRQNQAELPRLLGDILTGPGDDEARATAALAAVHEPPVDPDAPPVVAESAPAIPSMKLRVLVLPFEVDAAAATATPLAYLPGELLRAHLSHVETLDMVLPTLPLRAKPTTADADKETVKDNDTDDTGSATLAESVVCQRLDVPAASLSPSQRARS
ncbi:MAG: hypothetical protein AB7S36_06205, partial [Planctomycetota bacterium]